ncbi:MAG: hypothetical protein HQK54_06960 [Oligoflexales bacterium]|nr:hypothetical protein [Oligoflexales bacterium]
MKDQAFGKKIFVVMQLILFITVIAMMVSGFASPIFNSQFILLYNSSSLYFLLIGMNLFFYGITGFSCLASKAYDRDEPLFLMRGGLICGYGFTLSLVEMVNLLVKMSFPSYVFTIVTFNALIVFHIFFLVSENIGLKPRWSYWIATTPAFVIVLTSIGSLTFYKSMSFDIMVESLLSLRFLIYTIMPVIFILMGSSISMLNVSMKKKISLRKRFFNLRDNPTGIGLFYITIVTGVIENSTVILLRTFSPVLGDFPFYMVTLNWIPVLWFVFSKYGQYDEIEIFKSSPLTRPFRSLSLSHIRSEVRGNIMGGVTEGVRSANFFIDHDTQKETEKSFSNSLSQIRREEILKCFKTLLGERILDFNIVGSQITGSINSEFSQRACLDVLKLFAAVCWKVVPVIERRIKNLIQLFPIIDPNLALRFEPSMIDSMIRRMNWLFYLDYSWVDQHMIQQGAEINYSIFDDFRTSREKRNILDYLYRNNPGTQLVWLSERARNRLMMEAPFIGGLIESWPVTYSQGSLSEKEDVTLIFIIRLNNLISTLYKYYDLQNVIEKIRDYHLRKSTKDFLDKVEGQVSDLSTPSEIIDNLLILKEYNFRGYLEKDAALKVVVNSFNRIFRMQTEKDTASFEYVRQKLCELVKEIGFPSQNVYMEHNQKRLLKSTSQILEIAMNPGHWKFEAAWVYMATMDPSIYKTEELVDILKMVQIAIEKKDINDKAVFKNKVIEVFYNIAGIIHDPRMLGIVERIINQLALYLVNTNADIETISFFMESKIYLEDELKTKFTFRDEVYSVFETYLNKMMAEVKTLPNTYKGLLHRWNVFSNAMKSIGGESVNDGKRVS